MEKVRVVKLEEREDAEVPNNKEVGYFKEGFSVDKPEVGREFLLYMEFGEKKTPIPIWHTSRVMEILSEDTFKTRNSIYKILPL
jgi:hypothetical protein